MEQLMIIGSGPAGLTAAIYAARGFLNPLLITGNELGGQIATTTDVDNFPGFPNGVTGPELYDQMQRQAERFGTRTVFDEVVAADLLHHPFKIRTTSDEFETKALIIATGASPRKLGVPGENEFLGRGVSYCATCDGFFFRNKEVMVVGGGDSALQEGLFLTKFANRVRIIHRRESLRAGPSLQERMKKNEKMQVVWNSAIREIQGNGAVQTVKLEDTRTGAQSETPVSGVFVYIGHEPNTGLFKDQLAMDHEGYLIADARLHTSIPGVFAAGEVHDKVFRQAIASAGYGCMASMEAEKFLAELEDKGYPD
ncbi:MAG: thioredoxin-disulfide reductase, partial [Chloroflexi bacterium]|nr:thioredoxin-disulfide reductase [Chloroflexota bacterium]